MSEVFFLVKETDVEVLSDYVFFVLLGQHLGQFAQLCHCCLGVEHRIALARQCLLVNLARLARRVLCQFPAITHN
jgi:hypothetical protein